MRCKPFIYYEEAFYFFLSITKSMYCSKDLRTASFLKEAMAA